MSRSLAQIHHLSQKGKKPWAKNRERTAKGGFSQSARENLIRGSIFSDAQVGLLGRFKKSLGDPKRRHDLLDILESRTKSPLPLGDLLGVFEKFAYTKRVAGNLITRKDLGVLSFAVKYFEDWFYRGEWLNLPEERQNDERAYAYFSVPAGLINFLTKIKESVEHPSQFADLDRQKLDEFIRRVLAFASDYLEISRFSENKARRRLSLQRQAWQTFSHSLDSVESELNRKQIPKEAGGQTGADLYLLKTCLIAAEMQRRVDFKAGRHVFQPPQRFETVRNEYVNFDFSSGKDRLISSMHYSTHRLPFAFFAVEYLRQKPK